MTGGGVLIDVESGVAVMTLNRPAAMNALTLSMIETLRAKLCAWAGDGTIAAVVVRGAGDRAFCAGGDIRALFDAHKDGGPLTETFFRAEYQLNRLIYHYPKPYIALIDGVVMGGGVGISVHGRHRVLSEKTLFAMPETGIGMFPDVGGSFFLPRLPGELGMFLGLTGHRLRAADCIYAGIGDCYIPTSCHDELIGALRTGGDISATLSQLSEDAGEPPLLARRDLIDRCFSAASVPAIERALENDDGEGAADMLAAMRSKSPISQMIAYRQLRAGAALDFDGCMVMEYRLSQHVMAGHDFAEGVRAMIIDKDNTPDWRPSALSQVSPDMVEGYFAPPPSGDLTFGD